MRRGGHIRHAHTGPQSVLLSSLQSPQLASPGAQIGAAPLPADRKTPARNCGYGVRHPAGGKDLAMSVSYDPAWRRYRHKCEPVGCGPTLVIVALYDLELPQPADENCEYTQGKDLQYPESAITPRSPAIHHSSTPEKLNIECLYGPGRT